MGKLIKNHWARLVILTAAACKSNNKSNTNHFKVVTNTP